MRTILRILAAVTAVVSVAMLWLGANYVLFLQNEDVQCHRFTLAGVITSQTFVAARDCLVRSRTATKTIVVMRSAGGNGQAALALGILIHRHGWDVEVVDLCPSSCAIFIFPAGKKKYLDENSLLLFHGGPYQANLMENAVETEQESTKNGATVESVTVGHVNKEATVTYSSTRSKADEEVLEFLSMAKVSTAVNRVQELRTASDQFYQELGVNPALSTYGQIGAYEPAYKSYQHGGFTYRLDSLRRLGLANIELPDGEWHPERNPAYRDVYEVTYP